MTGAARRPASRHPARRAPRGLFRIAAILLAALLLSWQPSRSRAEGNLELEEAPGAEFALLGVRLGDRMLSEAMPCYQTDMGTLVPLGALAELLGLAIDVNATDGVAEGFFIRETRRFRLDTRTRSVIVEGREKTYDPARVVLTRHDILVETALLASWLPVDMSVDPYQGLLRVRPREPLPLQQRWERQQRIEMNQARSASWTPGGPLESTPRTLWDMPFTDQTLTLATASSGAPGQRFQVEHTAYVVTELLYTEVAARLTEGNNGQVTEFHARAARRDPDGGLLGPLRAREVAGGEVVFPGLDLVAQPATSDGVLVSNFPLEQPSQFDRHTFQGSLPPGWEVELYRNGAIIAYQQADARGTYAFENVPLFYGRNVFERTFYGPQGQRHSERDVFEVGRDLTPPRTSWYRVVSSGAGSDAERSLVEWNHGLTSRLSTAANLASVRLRGTTHRYAVAGASLLTGRVLGRVSAGGDAAGGRVASADVQTRRAGVGLRLRHTLADGFQSEVLNDVAGRRQISALRVDATLRPPVLPPLPMVVEYSHDAFGDADGVNQVTGQLAASTHGFSVSNQSTWRRTRRTALPAAERATGMLLVNRRMRRVSLRGELDYRVTGQDGPSAISLVADAPAGRRAVVGAGMKRELVSGQWHYEVGYERSEGILGVGFQGTFIPGSGVAGNLRLTMGLNREPREGAWAPHALPVADAGAVSARVFLDTNGNGIMDPGELPIDDAQLVLNDAADLARTDSAGVAFASNLPAYRRTNVGVASASLEDPQWTLEHAALQIMPRAGKVSRVDFAVVLTGEVAGTVRTRGASGTLPAEGVVVELVPANGKGPARITRSDYDGFYNFAELRPGTYTLRIPAAATQRRGLVPASARTLVIDPRGTVWDGVDFELESLDARPLLAAAAPSAVAPASADSILARRLVADALTGETPGVNAVNAVHEHANLSSSHRHRVRHASGHRHPHVQPAAPRRAASPPPPVRRDDYSQRFLHALLDLWKRVLRTVGVPVR